MFSSVPRQVLGAERAFCRGCWGTHCKQLLAHTEPQQFFSHDEGKGEQRWRRPQVRELLANLVVPGAGLALAQLLADTPDYKNSGCCQVGSTGQGRERLFCPEIPPERESLMVALRKPSPYIWTSLIKGNNLIR